MAEAYSRLAGIYDEIVVDPCYQGWATYLHELWDSDEAGVRSVLDVGCGTGLMARELVALGYRVVGVDGSAAMLARARRLLGPKVVLIQRTLPDLAVGGVFDAAISTFDALNYLTPAQLRATLVALSRRLRIGGWLVFDLHTDAMMDFAESNAVVTGDADGHHFAIVSSVDVPARTCDTRIHVTRTSDGDTFSEHHRQYFFTDAQVRRALVDAGFGRLAVTDEYSHQSIGGSTLRATWAARRLVGESPTYARPRRRLDDVE
ncbi:MAG: class I SAM-dependent methyltransferase [Candidatus Nanopelagicales bacterium]